MPKVSIVIPAYNEAHFIGDLLQAILAVDLAAIGFEREIIVIDDGSTDATLAIAGRYPEVRAYHQDNQGKGSAVKNGMGKATGDYVLVQDADLEYNPADYIALLQPVMKSAGLVAVYGSRILGQRRDHPSALFPGRHPDQSLAPWVANILLSIWAYILYGRFITDTLTGYKLYPTKVLKQFTIRTTGFETDHELTAKLLRSGIPIVEVPVDYRPRTVKEGKKIRTSDFFKAVWTFWKFRWERLDRF